MSIVTHILVGEEGLQYTVAYFKDKINNQKLF